MCRRTMAGQEECAVLLLITLLYSLAGWKYNQIAALDLDHRHMNWTKDAAVQCNSPQPFRRLI